MKESKTLKLFARGGLVNQLFQVLALEKLSRDLDRNPIISIDWFESSFQKNSNLNTRNFELGAFSTFNYIPIESTGGYSKARVVRERLSLASKGFLAPFLGYELEFNKKTNPILAIKKNVDLMGYFIHDNEIASRRSFISERLKLSHVSNPVQIKKTVNEISDEFVAIHLRLTDYKSFPEIFGVTNLDYFLRALELVKGLGADIANLLVFTDDCSSAEKFLGNSIAVKQYISPESSLSTSQQLLLMSTSKWLICSNSTFSWWAGFLSDPSITQVVFPREYMKGISSKDYGLQVAGWNYL